MKRFLIGAVLCMSFGLGFSSSKEASAQTIQKFGSVMRIELTDGRDNAIIDRVTVRHRVYIRLRLPLEVPRLAQANGVTMIWVDAKRGNDTVVFSGNLSAYVATVFCGEGDDYVDLDRCASGIVYGESGNDTIYGTDGFDSISGDSGNDMIFGLGDFDMLRGGSGRDTISGGDGNDWIKPGTGESEGPTWGGAGADRFYILPSHWLQAYQVPYDYNGLEGDTLVSRNWNF